MKQQRECEVCGTTEGTIVPLHDENFKRHYFCWDDIESGAAIDKLEELAG